MYRVAASDIRYKSGGLSIKALLAKPEASGAFPGLVAAHGGLSGLDEAFRSKCAELAASGFVVIAPSFRGEDGSEGEVDVGGGDVDDTLAAAELLSQREDVTDSIGIWGNSRGGLVALLAVARSSRFAAAATSAALVSAEDLYRIFAGRDDPFLPVLLKSIGGRPEEAPEEYCRRSALLQAAYIRCPLLIMHGDADTVVPVDSARRMERALCDVGKSDYEVRIFTGAGHRFLTEGDQAREATEHLVGFLRKHLGGILTPADTSRGADA